MGSWRELCNLGWFMVEPYLQLMGGIVSLLHRCCQNL
jgi:hypothetical protein